MDTSFKENLTKEFEITDKLDNTFRVFYRDYNNFECKKVLSNGSLVDPTTEELISILKEIQKKLEMLKRNSFIQTYDTLLMSIKNLIDNGTLNSLDEIKNYIDNLNISSKEKDKLLQESYKYLESKSVQKTPITSFKDKIIEILRKEKKEGQVLIASFNIKKNITGIDVCEITVSKHYEKGYIEIEKQPFDYNEELKKELIDPVIEELVLSSEIEPVNPVSVPGEFYRSNMQINTTDNRIASLNNIEEGYANYLKQHIDELSKEAKIKDNNERDTRLDELQYEKNDEKTLKRIKPEDNNKGFSNSYLIYGIISLITTILIVLQILIKA